MEKMNKYMLAGVFLLGAGASVIVFGARRYTSFKRVVSNRINMEEIAALELTRLSSKPGEKKDIVITEPADIRRILGDFLNLQLTKSSKNITSDKKFSYYITIVQKDRSQRFDLILKSREHLIIYDNDWNAPRLNAYKVTNAFNPQALESAFG